jgi:uncharacterized membrane protein
MKKHLISLGLLAISISLLCSLPVYAQETPLPNDLNLEEITSQLNSGQAPSIAPDAFYKGRVVKIVSEKDEQNDLNIAGAPSFIQTVKVELLNGPHKETQIEVQYGGLKGDQKLKEGEKVFIQAPNGTDDPKQFYIFERYRLSSLYWLAAFFILVTIFFARWRGFTSLLGLGVSISVLALYVVPQILAGKNPLIVTLIGSLLVATIALYLAHGFNRRTSIALASTLITIVIAIGLSTGFVWFTKLTGIGSEEAFYLQTSPVQGINLKGLLLGGIIIGALGVLDDITTSQAAAVHEIYRANPRLKRRDLIQRGLSVGREHITSLVNTLALAYAGASLPALLLFIIYQRPFLVVLNTEAIAEEIVRTLVGSIALMCAVPITTALAAYFLSVQSPTANDHITEHVGYSH